jgi:hypothetical protein
MSSRLTVIFYIILCLEIGIVLTFLPWVSHGFLGLSDWGNNYFLLVASRRVGFRVQRFKLRDGCAARSPGINSEHRHGPLGLINFRRTVRALDGSGLIVELTSESDLGF